MKKIILMIAVFTAALLMVNCKGRECVPPEMTRINLDDYPLTEDIKDKIIVGKTDEGIVVTAQDLYDWLDLFYSGKKNIILSDPAETEKIINDILEQKIGVYIAKSRGYDREPDFLNSLQMLKKNWEVRAEYNLVKKLITLEVDKRIDRSAAALRKFYRENKNDIDRYYVYLIITQCFENSTQEEVIRAKNKIEEAYSLLKKGESFPSVARIYLEGNPDWVAQGGLIGWVHLGESSKVFDYNLERMKEGKFSEPFRSREGWVIIYVEKIEKFAERENYIKALYYDKMVGRLNIPVKKELVGPYKRQIYLDTLDKYIKGKMSEVEKSIPEK